MADIAQLHGLGVRLVVVAGCQPQIDVILKGRGSQPAYVGGYRVTDKQTLSISIEAAGNVRTACEQFLSKGPAIPMIRRHTKGDGEIHFEPAMRVISGNYVTAKRRGVVDGVDFGYTGEVRFVLKDDISRQLEGGNVVLLSNLGFTAAGEVLNCNTYDVGLHAAVELGADKLFFLHTDEVADLGLPHWLPLSGAQQMLIKKLEDSLSSEQMDTLKASMDTGSQPPDPNIPSWRRAVAAGAGPVGPSGRAIPAPVPAPEAPAPDTAYPASPRELPQQAIKQQVQRAANSLATKKREDLVVDLDVWSASGYPPAVSTCVIACCKGVKRAHLLDARIDGGLLLELYSRDGVGTMISADFYEGIRRAGPADVDAIRALLKPLEDAGVLVKRSAEEIHNMVHNFTVIERETKVMGCALLLPLGLDEEGVCVAELGAFCVDPAFRGSGRGDSLLDYVEQEARASGIQRLVLLTTRTADWFEQRDFKWSGPAYASVLLPQARRSRINPTRNSQLYVKQMEAADETTAQPGKRIGF